MLFMRAWHEMDDVARGGHEFCGAVVFPKCSKRIKCAVSITSNNEH